MLNLILSLLIVLSMAAHLPFPSFHALTDRYWALHSVASLRYGQLSSHLHHSPHRITLSPHTLSIGSLPPLESPPHITLSSNRHHLGFKPNFRTPYAGTLFIQTPRRDYRITFPVGITLLKWHR